MKTSLLMMRKRESVAVVAGIAPRIWDLEEDGRPGSRGAPW